MSENVNDAKRGFLKTAVLGAGTLGTATPGVALAQMRVSFPSASDPSEEGKPRHRRGPRPQDGRTMTQRVIAESCVGAIIDIQDYFLAHMSEALYAHLDRTLGSIR